MRENKLRNGFSPKLNNCVFSCLWTHLEKPQITQMRAFSPRSSSLSSLRSDLLRKPFSLAQGSSKLSPFAAALELPKLFSNSQSNAKAAAKGESLLEP